MSFFEQMGSSEVWDRSGAFKRCFLSPSFFSSPWSRFVACSFLAQISQNAAATYGQYPGLNKRSAQENSSQDDFRNVRNVLIKPIIRIEKLKTSPYGLKKHAQRVLNIGENIL
jgi:hypothetical protein